jgi:hypothetical protein
MYAKLPSNNIIFYASSQPRRRYVFFYFISGLNLFIYIFFSYLLVCKKKRKHNIFNKNCMIVL